MKNIAFKNVFFKLFNFNLDPESSKKKILGQIQNMMAEGEKMRNL